MKQVLLGCGTALVLGGGIAPHAAGVGVSYGQPVFDRWNYPFNFTPGVRDVSATFGSGGSPSFDDADGQFYFAFDTSSDFATGLGASNYTVNSVTVTVTTQDGGFAYDPTYDGFETYAPRAGVDADAGRPVQLMGAGFRGGFTAGSYGEAGAFAPPGPPAPDARNAFAADVSGPTPVDASNFVRDGLDITPLAIGEVAGLTPGDLVPDTTTFSFEVDLSDPEVLAYFQRGLNEGLVPLSVISLHPAAQDGSLPIPRLFNKESLNPAAVPATLTIDAVPEPGSLSLLGGLAGVALVRRRRG